MVSDTVFKETNLGNSFLKVVASGTSKYCSYHAGFLVFCLKFRFSSACEYLNEYLYKHMCHIFCLII